MTTTPKILTVYATSKKACTPVNASYLIVRNRGDADVELSIENGDSTDTFLLKPDEREKFGPSEYKRLCYRRADHNDTKVRLDVHAF